MEDIKQPFTYKQDEQGNYVKLQGMSCGFYKMEPMELSTWEERTDNISDLSSIEIMALFYTALLFIKDNSEFFGIESLEDIDNSNAIQGGSVYLNDFDGYLLSLSDGSTVKLSRITYTTNDAIIVCGYELDTDNERAWLLA